MSALLGLDLRQTNKTKTGHHTVKYQVVERVETQDKNILAGPVAIEQGVMVLN